MDKVFEKHDINELMQNERWSKIREMVRPHFKQIGRPLAEPKEVNEGKLLAIFVSQYNILQKSPTTSLCATWKSSNRPQCQQTKNTQMHVTLHL
jgi:predicted alternative tryptophan synthase beta-subunit